MRQLFSNNGINYYILNQSFRGEAVELLTHSSMQIPVVTGLYAKGYHFSYQQWKTLRTFYIDKCIENRLATVAVDPQSNKVVGAVLAKDHHLEANLPSMKPIGALLKEAKDRFLKKNPNFFQSYKVAVLFCIGVNENYRQRQIAYNLIKSSQNLCRFARYQYTEAEAANPYTSNIFQKLGYVQQVRLSVKDLEMQGEKPFSQVKEADKIFIYWTKKL